MPLRAYPTLAAFRLSMHDSIPREIQNYILEIKESPERINAGLLYSCYLMGYTRKMRYGNAFLTWLPLAAAITGLSLLVYGTVQQNYRQSLNDPQIQIAEDASRILSGGVSPASIAADLPRVDISQSLAPWVVIYDEKGNPIAGSGFLNGALPKLPQGALDAAASNEGKDTDVPGQNRVTWQSGDGTRSAVVVQHYSDKNAGFVVAGRNMREVEGREGQLNTMVALAWLVTMLATLILQLAGAYFRVR
jgi:hypothetical protein